MDMYIVWYHPREYKIGAAYGAMLVCGWESARKVMSEVIGGWDFEDENRTVFQWCNSLVAGNENKLVTSQLIFHITKV